MNTIENNDTKVSKPIWSNRLSITGYFINKKTIDTLTEFYFDKHTNQEVNEICSNIDYDSLVSIASQKDYRTKLISNNQKLTEFSIPSGPCFGLEYLNNEGDLNGDGIDEISFIVSHADYSSINTLHIITFKNQKWTELKSLPIWEWQIPNNQTDSINPFIKPLNNDSTMVWFRNDEAMLDSTKIKL